MLYDTTRYVPVRVRGLGLQKWRTSATSKGCFYIRHICPKMGHCRHGSICTYSSEKTDHENIWHEVYVRNSSMPKLPNIAKNIIKYVKKLYYVKKNAVHIDNRLPPYRGTVINCKRFRESQRWKKCHESGQTYLVGYRSQAAHFSSASSNSRSRTA